MADLHTRSNKDLARLLDCLDDESERYLDKVSQAVYSGIAEELPDQLPESPLLIAVAALIIGSCRGRITSVTNYNYDDLLK